MADQDAGGGDVPGVSPFALRDAFPDAQGIFTVRHSTLDEIKGTCFVVLDANVLLLPYKLEEVSLPEVIKVYQPLATAGRLVIPAQAAREFAKHRSQKVSELVRYLRQQASAAGPDLKRKIGALVGRADYDAAKELIGSIEQKLKEIRTAINKLADGVSANVGEDPVSVAYREVFAGTVGADPVAPADEGAFGEELKRRYAERRPPGFKDKSKPDSGAGDLLIWKSILAEGRTRQASCIFVTGDEKSDWYVQSDGAFQPRLELLEEYRAAAQATLHILPLSGLLKLMSAPTAAVEDVERAEAVGSAVYLGPGIRIAPVLSPDRAFDDYRSSGTRKHARAFRLAAIDIEVAELDSRINALQENVSSLPPATGNLSLPWERAWVQQSREIADLIERKQVLLEERRSLSQQ